jgi:FkbM family methyltransferase
MLSLLRKIKSIVFNNTNSRTINHPDLKMGLVNGDITNFTYKNLSLVYRNVETSSDLNVIKQIFIDEEYNTVLSYFLTNKIEPKFIIDAGANIGLTSVYIKAYFPNTRIACIEPDYNNFKLLNKNLSSFIDDKSIAIYKAGLMGRGGINLHIGEDFRGGSDWAKQTFISNEDSELKSITIQDIINDQKFPIIDLLKIDIEGGETFLLEDETDLSFLDKTKAIAIEIHDEYDCRIQIYSTLKKYNYFLLETGETTLAINKTYING